MERPMISHCANPECGAPFHYLRGGRLYRFEVHPLPPDCADIPNAICTRKISAMTVYFWLCEDCSSRMALKFHPRRGLLLKALTRGEKPPRTPVIVQEEAEDIPQQARQDRVLSCDRCRPIGNIHR